MFERNLEERKSLAAALSRAGDGRRKSIFFDTLKMHDKSQTTQQELTKKSGLNNDTSDELNTTSGDNSQNISSKRR